MEQLDGTKKRIKFTDLSANVLKKILLEHYKDEPFREGFAIDVIYISIDGKRLIIKWVENERE